MNITVIGLGYVGLSIAILLSQKNKVLAYDINAEKVNLINNKKSPINDKYINDYLQNKNINLIATTNFEIAIKEADFIIISIPTNFNKKTNYFETTEIINLIQKIRTFNLKTTIILKSTLPIGFCNLAIKEFKNIIFCPEFLREGFALYDNLYPSRIIIGLDVQNKILVKNAKIFVKLLKQSAIKKQIKTLYMGYSEAESVKLFSNAYLAMRIAFFNELDSFAEINKLNTKQIIEGISNDKRIGNYYNNPSFGFGGYCLPKDTCQLMEQFSNIPSILIKSIIKSNQIRKQQIVQNIIRKISSESVVGIYRLNMKTNSDNFRESAVLEIIDKLNKKNIKLIIYEPLINANKYNNIEIYKNIDLFKNSCDLIIANRIDENITDVLNLVYSKDIFKYN